MSIPVTIDGHEIPLDAPRSAGMSDEQAQIVSTKAEEYRAAVLHCHYDLADRTITVFAANAPDGPVGFNFGDRSAEVDVPAVGGQAQAEHTYANDDTYHVGVRAGSDRWFTDVAVNWPAPIPAPPLPEEDA